MPAEYDPIVLSAAAEHCATCGARPHSVCSAVPLDDLARLAAAATKRTVRAGETLLHEGDAADAFYNVASGTARLSKLLPDGRRQIIGFARPGYFLGLDRADVEATTVEALEPMRVCRFSRARMCALCDAVPEMEHRLLQFVASEWSASQDHILLLGRKTARERVASFLIGWAKGGRHCGPPVSRIALPMTRADIADYLGLTVETVSRVLSRLRGEGLVQLPLPAEIVLTDSATLAAIAAGEA